MHLNAPNFLAVGALCLLTLVSCVSVSTIREAQSIPPSQCNVKIFSSLDAAKSLGKIEELCIITGSSVPSFSHTVSTAIENHKNRACACGARNVYIQDQTAGQSGGASSVTLVAFRFISETLTRELPGSFPSQQVTKEIIEKARKCQAKGGVWLNYTCQIDVE